jgi:hypothetical protein
MDGAGERRARALPSRQRVDARGTHVCEDGVRLRRTGKLID